MKLGEINVRRMDEEKDGPTLEGWRRAFTAGDLEIPHGWHGKPGRGDEVATVVAVKGEELVASLTGILSVVLDPFIRNPKADPRDIITALVKLETVLSAAAQNNGAIDQYIAIPNSIVKSYGKVLEGYGFAPTVQNCTVYRRPLRPDHVPLLGDERDAMEREANAPEPASVE